MKFKKRLPEQIRSSCNEIQPDDGVDPRTFFRKPSRKGANRKALQLCSQIAQTLTSVFDWETGDDRLRGLAVQSVEPAPDSSCVLVTLWRQATTDEVDAGQVIEGLRRWSANGSPDRCRKTCPCLSSASVGPTTYVTLQ
jgi:hypothetical protein